MSNPAPNIKYRNLPLLLLQARSLVIARFRPIFKANRITEQQWRIIRLLLDRGVMEPREIGRLCAISSPSMAGILARMEQLGFIERQRSPLDQRRVHVMLAQPGRDLASRVLPEINATYAAMEKSLGTQFMGDFHQILDEMIAAMDSEGDWPESE